MRTDANRTPNAGLADRMYTAREKIRIVLKGMRGEQPVQELCRTEGVPLWLYYRWCLMFLEAGKLGLMDDEAYGTMRNDRFSRALQAV